MVLYEDDPGLTGCHNYFLSSDLWWNVMSVLFCLRVINTIIPFFCVNVEARCLNIHDWIMMIMQPFGYHSNVCVNQSFMCLLFNVHLDIFCCIFSHNGTCTFSIFWVAQVSCWYFLLLFSVLMFLEHFVEMLWIV